MPVNPFPVNITVYDTDNATVKSGARVYVRNITKKSTSDQESSNSLGLALIDLSDLSITAGQSVEYSAGDEYLVVAYYGNSHDCKKFKVSGESNEVSLYLNPIRHIRSQENNLHAVELVRNLIVANTTSTVYWAKVYDFDTGRIITWVECPANNTVPLTNIKMRCSGGMVVEREHQGLVVTAIQ